MLTASRKDYGSIAKLLHWGLATLILWQLLTGVNLHGMEFSAQKAKFIWFHQVIGTLIFSLIALRLIWRFYNRPKFEETLPKLHKWGSKIVHFLLYALCLWLPIQGSLMTWSGGFDVYLVGLIKIPALVAENKEMYPTFVSFHYATAMALLSLTLIHIAAGLYHRFIAKDAHGVWKRMAISFQKPQSGR